MPHNTILKKGESTGMTLLKCWKIVPPPKLEINVLFALGDYWGDL